MKFGGCKQLSSGWETRKLGPNVARMGGRARHETEALLLALAHARRCAIVAQPQQEARTASPSLHQLLIVLRALFSITKLVENNSLIQPAFALIFFSFLISGVFLCSYLHF